MLRALTLAGMLISTTALAQAPQTRRSRLSDVYHGVKVNEDYRWLEDWGKPEVKKWSASQNKYARSHLDRLPQVAAIRTRITGIMKTPTAGIGQATFRGGKFFIQMHEPPLQQPFIIVTTSLGDLSRRVVVDPNKIDKSGATSIDWFKPSPDGKLIAVSLSKAGTERGDLTVFRTSDGRPVHEAIPYVNSGTAGGDLAWQPSGKGFYYTRHFKSKPSDPKDNNVYQHLYYHALGNSPKKDRYELGKGFPQIAEIQLDVNPRSGRLLATVQRGDGGEFAHYLRGLNAKWRKFSSFGDKIVQAVFGTADELYVVSQQSAPRGKLLRMAIGDLSVSKSTTVIPEGEDTIVSSGIAFWGEATVLPMKDRLYVVYQLGGPSEIRAFDLQGRSLTKPRQLPVSAVHGLITAGGEKIVFGNNSFVEPNALYQYDPAGGTKPTAYVTKSPVDFSDVQVVREFATSKDGTKIPLNIIIPKGLKRDGSNPCIVYGYGGYGVNITPRFRAMTKVLSEQGVIYAVANIRGGGEYGEQWHRQGNLTRKQNVFDDFAAAVRHMIDRRYSSSKRMGIMGGSNGGLLMGATMTQNPDLVTAVVSFVGIYDMLRVELSPNGKFNITEFGTVTNPEHFKALLGYSPYHNVKDKTAYPATLFLTGANDPRVDPMQSRKMTARLQAATSSGAPILLRTSADTGHGGNSSLSARIEESVDVHAFFFHHLGVKYQRRSE